MNSSEPCDEHEAEVAGAEHDQVAVVDEVDVPERVHRLDIGMRRTASITGADKRLFRSDGRAARPGR